MKKEETNEMDFMQFHKAMGEIVDKYMVEIVVPAIRAKCIAHLCYIGMLMGAFLMFLACV